MLSTITSVAVVGLQALPITVEVDIASHGLPHFVIVGLPNKSVDEARERVRSAIRNSGFEFPNKKITINLAPADVPKTGSGYDLPIALGILKASGQLECDFENILIYGELSLNGEIRPCMGTVLYAILAKERTYRALFVPTANEREALLIDEASVFACPTLKDVVKHFSGEEVLARRDYREEDVPLVQSSHSLDMADVFGQQQAKRALEISAAGGHNMIMIGSPGSGKTLLARTFPTILPEISREEAIELTKLYSVAGLLSGDMPIINFRPFRSPHHTASIPSIVGGGAFPKPGEISLAHRGVLFMDELLEFPKSVLESLRQPLEDGRIVVSRTSSSVSYPAKFIFLAASNPCPCGYAEAGDPAHPCSCSSSQITTYRKRLSGPILDRIDLQLKVMAVPVGELGVDTRAERSAVIRKRVQQARDRQLARFTDVGIYTNAEMTSRMIGSFCMLDSATHTLLALAVDKLHLSARSYQRVVKVSRTIADLSQSEQIQREHIAEALTYRFTAEQ
jgi:magnesium chelatase family protein